MALSNGAVGLLGGSFDPVHNGHISIARSFLNSSYISELWVLLTPESPHKQTEEKTEYDLRFEMLQLAFSEIENTKISDFEQKLSPPYYTVETLRRLNKVYKERQLFLCMGEDSLMHFNSWYRWKEILEYCNLLVARRPSYDAGGLDKTIRDNSYFVWHEPMDISSTEIRKKIQRGKRISDLVPSEVERFIVQHKLYQPTTDG